MHPSVTHLLLFVAPCSLLWVRALRPRGSSRSKQGAGGESWSPSRLSQGELPEGCCPGPRGVGDTGSCAQGRGAEPERQRAAVDELRIKGTWTPGT